MEPRATSLSRKRDLKLEIHPDAETNLEDIVTLKIGGQDYQFSKEQIEKYPKLLDPDSAFTIGFDAVLPLIWGYPPSVLDPKLFDENHEKELFLANCEFFGIKLSDDMILHLSSKLHDEIKQSSELISRREGKKGERKIRSTTDREVVAFASEFDHVFSESGSSLRPIDIITYLSLGTPQMLQKLVIEDFKSKNLILPFIKKFLERFL